MGDLVKNFVERRNEQLHMEKPPLSDFSISSRLFNDLFENTHYILLKNEKYSKWFECPACKLKFETDASGMNCVNVITEGTGPTGRGRTSHWEPACPKCFRLEGYRE